MAVTASCLLPPASCLLPPASCLLAMIAIIDYGVGNLRSVEKAFAAVGAQAVVTSDAGAIRAAERLVLPGVGAFGECARQLRASRLDQLVLEAAEQNRPVLGLCVGLQLMFDE